MRSTRTHFYKQRCQLLKNFETSSRDGDDNLGTIKSNEMNAIQGRLTDQVDKFEVKCNIYWINNF